jgi:hypothetical protein
MPDLSADEQPVGSAPVAVQAQILSTEHWSLLATRSLNWSESTVIRLVQLNSVDVELVIGMNRLRRGYLDLAPELERYFVTGHREDVAGIMQTYGARRTRIPASQYLSSIALLVSVIVAVLIGALAGMIGDSFDVRLGLAVIIGIAAALATLILAVVRPVNRTWACLPSAFR